MCGILGYIYNTQNHINEKIFMNALDKMHHRGPDGFGIFHDENILLGHRRLSIIDISVEANQPFLSKTANASITFNGEIYNYKELKSDLQLTTNSDTEVLLEGYLKYGKDFFKRIRGIYAFAIYDYRNTKKCILYRDPGGIKPLYIYNKGNELIFASEIKSILPLLPQKLSINKNILKQYIHLGYCPEPETIYNEISTLAPGQFMEFDIDTKTYHTEILFKYEFLPKNKTSEEESTSMTKELLNQACKRNLVADVELSIALSGGIDSSLIFALSNENNQNKIKGITISFDEKKYDESEVASAYAEYLKAPHIIEKVEIDNKLEFLNSLLIHFDQPYADSSFIPFYFLSNKASSYSKVLIGGDSGDEIHNGYTGYSYLPIFYKLSQSYLRKPLTLILSSIARVTPSGKKRILIKISNLLNCKNFSELIFYWESWFPPNSKAYPINPFNYNPDDIKLPADDSGNTLCDIERKYFYGRMLSDYLRKSDMMSMLNSLEFRVPMLDEDLVNYSFKIPYNYKSDIRNQKKILRRIHSKIFPSHFSNLKKNGFSIPLDTWLGKSNIETIRHYVMKDESFVSKYISKGYMDILFKSIGNIESEKFVSRESAYQRLLIIYSLELWHENNSQYLA